MKSIDSGYVSRVQVSTSGFGKVIYINHANNLTSVYAHLSRFSDKIEKIINQLQYKNKSYEIRKFFKKDELKISKKEILGFYGNTGTSFAIEAQRCACINEALVDTSAYRANDRAAAKARPSS